MAHPNVNLSGPRTAINLTGSGDNIVITGTAGTVIAIFKLVYWCATAVTVVLKDGSTAINGTNGFNHPAQGGFAYDGDENPLIMGVGNNFTMNLGGSANVNGWVYYSQTTVPTV